MMISLCHRFKDRLLAQFGVFSEQSTRLLCLSLTFEAQVRISDLSQNVERPIGPVCLENKHA